MTTPRFIIAHDPLTDTYRAFDHAHRTVGPLGTEEDAWEWIHAQEAILRRFFQDDVVEEWIRTQETLMDPDMQDHTHD